jgi:hypothetical protein
MAPEMQFTTRQARRSDVCETEVCGLGPRDVLLDWLIAQCEQATEEGMPDEHDHGRIANDR